MDRQQEYVNAYLQKQRQKKHRQIMNAITNYKRTPEQIKMLDKVKHATRMEIDLRFKNCPHNQDYKFPFMENIQDQQFQEQEFPNPNIVLYDLYSQTEVIKKSLSTKTLSLDAGRRVKSLQREQIPEQQQLISKIKRRPLQVGHEPVINEYLARKNSLKDRRVRNRSNFKLPQLKKLNNQSRNNLQEIVGKKINTQTSSPESKRLAKFLRGVQSDGKQLLNKDVSKKFFLKKV